jgi:hypothetical protein
LDRRVAAASLDQTPPSECLDSGIRVVWADAREASDNDKLAFNFRFHPESVECGSDP